VSLSHQCHEAYIAGTKDTVIYRLAKADRNNLDGKSEDMAGLKFVETPVLCLYRPHYNHGQTERLYFRIAALTKEDHLVPCRVKEPCSALTTHRMSLEVLSHLQTKSCFWSDDECSPCSRLTSDLLPDHTWLQSVSDPYPRPCPSSKKLTQAHRHMPVEI
jgi:hypothetical protein